MRRPILFVCALVLLLAFFGLAPTASGSPLRLPGDNQVCQKTGDYKICASVSDGTPARNSQVTIYGKLTYQKVGQAGLKMKTV